MRISKKLYIDERVFRHRWIIWKLRRNRKIKDIYCIIYTQDNFIEIINSNKLKNNNDILIGIATTRQRAIELLVPIFDEVYVPNPNIQEMKNYFIKNSR